MPGSDSVVSRSQLTPDASRIECRSAARWTGGAEVIVPPVGDSGTDLCRRLGRTAIVEQQLVERDVELGGDGVQGADRRVGPAGLDLRDQARRDAAAGRPARAGSGRARFGRRAAARPSADSRDGHPDRPTARCEPRRHGQNISLPLSTTSSTPSTAGSRGGTARRRRSRPSSRAAGGRLRHVALQDGGGFSDQYGLSPTTPGWSEFARSGLSSSTSVRVSPTTPPLTVVTVVEPG